jgi:hypothetical protein
VREVPFEPSAQDLVGRELDVVLDALELEALGVAVVHGVARAVVEVARLPDRAHAHDVLLVGLELEVDRGELLDEFGVSANTLHRCEWPMSVMCPILSQIARHSRACSGAKMYSNSSRRTGEPWQRSTSMSSSFSW